MRVTILLGLLSVAGAGARGVGSDVEVLEGGKVTLTCDTALPSAQDTLLLLVWYKNAGGKQVAIFSYDSRVPTVWVKEGLRLARPEGAVPGQRLHVGAAAAENEGEYHCRVDFQLSPTRNQYVNLIVIILPRPPFVQNEFGDNINGTLRHYHEGDNLVLTCYVIGGRPPPQILWYSGSSLIDASDSESPTLNMRENELYLPLSRDHGTAPLECRAANTLLAPPLTISLQIELYVSATSVSISWEGGAEAGGALVAGRAATAHCVALGAYPQPALSWWIDHEQIPGPFQQEWSGDTLRAESWLQLTPAPEQDGGSLSCVATNLLLAPINATKASTITLNVLYSPLLEVTKLSEGRVNETEEGKTLALRCDLRANPHVTRVAWYFNDSEISTLPAFPGGATGGPDLNLTAARAHTGRYACAANNSVGGARSEDMPLHVLYPAECVGSGVTLEAETVRCETDARPAADTFLWRVRGAGELQMLTTGTPTLRLSLLQGSLDTSLQVWCEGANSVGSQKRPCEATLSLKHLRPEPPTCCDINFLLDTFHVHCKPGSNATYHVLSVWRMSASNSSLVLAWRARSAYGDGKDAVGGSVGTLSAGDEAGVAACNNYGCSRDTLIRPSAELLQAAAPWWRGLLQKDVGISVGIVVMACVVVIMALVLSRVLGRFAKSKPAPVIQVLQLDDFTARDYIDTMERKSRSHKSCSSVYSTGSLEDCPPLVDRTRKPIVWSSRTSCRDCLPDLTKQLAQESAV